MVGGGLKKFQVPVRKGSFNFHPSKWEVSQNLVSTWSRGDLSSKNDQKMMSWQ